MSLEREVQSIGELPAIVCNGAIKILDPDLLKLDDAKLREIAMVMGGEVVYMKLRCTYTELETPLCGFRGCYRPAHDIWCTDHPGGRVKSKDNVRPFVNPRVS